MIERIAASSRFSRDYGFLKTHWLFSFSEYYDPHNMSFGALRVFNDDVIMPGGGFPDHPHDTMEIVTIVHDGELSHRDSMGNAAVIRPGMVQRMSAGTGVVHSEFNAGTSPVHLYQLWFYPNRATDAGYEEMTIPRNVGRTVLASDGKGGLALAADATLISLTLETDAHDEYHLSQGHGLFIYVMAGSLIINGVDIATGDQARITDESLLSIVSRSGVHAILIDTVVG